MKIRRRGLFRFAAGAIALPAVSRFAHADAYPSRPGTPADFGKLIADETAKWGKVIKFAGIKPE